MAFVLRKTLTTWGPLAAFSLLTDIVFITAWSSRYYGTILALLGVLSALSALFVFRHYGLRLWPTVAVVICLLIGQLWASETVLSWLTWSMRGFAP